MNLQQLLRLTLVFQWASIILYEILAGDFVQNLPSQLADYSVFRENQGPSDSESFALTASLPFILMFAVSSIGLFMLKQWAKWGYTLSYLTLAILSFGWPVLLEPRFVVTIGYFERIGFGFVLALIFFTNVLPKNGVNANREH